MRSAKSAAIAGAIVVVGCIWLFYFVGRESPSPLVVEEGLRDVSSSLIEPGSRRIASSVPLPPIDAPLRLTVSDLVRQADGGDARAACRLAIEYQRCGLVEQQLMHADDLTAGADVGDELPSASVPSDAGGFYKRVEHCRGVQAPDALKVAALLRQAAANGNAAAMAAYASGAGFSTDTILDDLDELREYQRLGPEIARRAVAAGDGAALLSLAAAHQPQNQLGARPFLAQAVSVDITESLALFSVARRELVVQNRSEGRLWDFVGRQISNLEARVSAEQRSESERRAASLQADVKHFRLPPDSDVAFLSRAGTRPLTVADCNG